VTPPQQINAQLEKAEQFFESFDFKCSQNYCWAVWVVKTEGFNFVPSLEINRSYTCAGKTIAISEWRPPFVSPVLSDWKVTAKFFEKDFYGKSDWEIYNIPHTWLPTVNEKASFHSLVTGAVHIDRRRVTICAWSKDYIKDGVFDAFEIVKLVSSWFTNYAHWKAGLSWTGGGQKHKRNLKNEQTLRKAKRRHNLSSASPTALAERETVPYSQHRWRWN